MLTDAVIRLVKPILARMASAGAARRLAQGCNAKRLEELDLTSDTRLAKVSRKRLWLRRPLIRFGWSSLVAFDLVLTYWAQVLSPLVRGLAPGGARVVIGDRYTYDALVELIVLADRRQIARSLMARLLMLLSPRPNRAYLLDVAPPQALAREPDESLEFLERQALVYREMALTWGLRIVDANSSLAEIADGLTHEVLAEFYRCSHPSGTPHPSPRLAYPGQASGGTG